MAPKTAPSDRLTAHVNKAIANGEPAVIEIHTPEDTPFRAWVSYGHNCDELHPDMTVYEPTVFSMLTFAKVVFRNYVSIHKMTVQGLPDGNGGTRTIYIRPQDVAG